MLSEYQFLLFDTVVLNNVLPPSANTLYRTNKSYRIYKPAPIKKFNEYVKNNIHYDKLLTQNLKLEIELYIIRDRDIDNSLKVLLDSFNGVIYNDDKQVFELNIKKIKITKKNDIKTVIKINIAVE
jgi:Holliday junction resolvase RusA-like endonuclease